MTAVTLQPDATAADLAPARAPAAAPSPTGRAPVSLRRNFLETLSGNVVYAACQWGVLVALAKLGNPQVVGVYALALAVISPVMLLSNLQLREVQATDAHRQYSPGEYLALRLLCTAAMLAVIGVMIVVMRPPRTTVWVIAWISLAKAADSVGDILFGLLQQKEWMRPVGAAQALNGLVTVGATGLAMWLTRSVAWAAAASALGSAVALGFAWATTVRLVGAAGARPRWHASALKALAVGSVPLGVVALLVSLNTNMPRYFVEHSFGERGLGLFAAIAYIHTAGAMVAAALAQSGAARLSQRYAAGDLPGFWRVLRKMMAVGAGLGLCGLAVALVGGRFVLTHLYRPEYAAAAPAFAWLMAAATVAYTGMFLNTAMLIVGARHAQTALFVVVLVVCVASCATLVPRYGLLGAAWAVGISYAVQIGGALRIVMRTAAARAGASAVASRPSAPETLP